MFPNEPCASVLYLEQSGCQFATFKTSVCGVPDRKLKIIFAAVLCNFSIELNSSWLLQHPYKAKP